MKTNVQPFPVISLSIWPVKKNPKTEIEKGRSFLFCTIKGKAKLSPGADRDHLPSVQVGLTKKGEAVSEVGAGMLSPVISWCTR